MYSAASKLRIFALVLALVSLIALGSGPVYGQAISGGLVGTVIDSSSAVVTSASVEATNVGTGATTTTKTSATGWYRFENLPVGTYRVAVKASGFRTVLQQVDVVLNQTGTLNVTLSPGATSETIEVSGVANTIDTTSAQIASTYGDRFSQDLGITSAGGTGAGVLNLSLLGAGVSQTSSLGLGVGPSVGGQRPRNNNFTVEGVDNNNKTVTGALISIPNDAVENFTLLSNQFNSEFGHSSGGQFNTTIKSGTNTFHGSVYEYFRNRNMNAVDNYFVLQGLTSNPRFDSNRYGGTFGGPIIKNKLFFFTNYERQPVGLTGTSGAAIDTPTNAGLAAIQADPNLSSTNFQIFNQYVPVAAAGTGCIPYNTAVTGPGNQGLFNAPANGSCAAGSVEVGRYPSPLRRGRTSRTLSRAWTITSPSVTSYGVASFSTSWIRSTQREPVSLLSGSARPLLSRHARVITTPSLRLSSTNSGSVSIVSPTPHPVGTSSIRGWIRFPTWFSTTWAAA